VKKGRRGAISVAFCGSYNCRNFLTNKEKTMSPRVASAAAKKRATSSGSKGGKKQKTNGGTPTPAVVLPSTSNVITPTVAKPAAEPEGGNKEEGPPSVSLDYLRKDLPIQRLTDKLLVEKVRVCVDNKFYPFDKYYSKSKYMSGVVQVAFIDMGWGRNSWEYAHKRATGMNAVIDIMAERVSDNREKSKLRCKKKFERKSRWFVAFPIKNRLTTLSFSIT
jgi:hypothetical protein